MLPGRGHPAGGRFALAEDGSVTDQPITILGPDLRESADGKSLGLAKTIAGLTGLRADDVFRRAERARRRRTRIWAGIAGVCILLAVAATGSAVYAWQELKTNEAFLNATLKTATDIVNTAVVQAEKYNVPSAVTLELLTKAEGLFDVMARYGRPTPELQFQKAFMLIEFARNYAILGDTGKERADAEQAYGLLAQLVAAKPDDNQYQRGLAAADEAIGDAQMAQGDLAGALKSYRDALAIAGRMAKTEPGNGLSQHNLADSYVKVGDVLREERDFAGALQSYRDDLAIAERLAESDPSNAMWQRDLSVSYERVGGVQEAQGDFAGALQSYRDGLAIAERLAQSHAGNTGLQRDLFVSNMAIGRVQEAKGDIAEALKSYQAARAIAERLAQSDPGNSFWQHDLSLAYSKVGDIQSAQDDLAAALKSYRDGLAILEKLAQSDPSNGYWQRDLAMSYAKVGAVLGDRNDFAGALKSFRDSLAITQRVAALDPGNKQWQDNLVLITAQIGSLLLLTHDFAGALAADDKAIARAPKNIALYINRADALMFLGRIDEARALYLKYRGQTNVLNGKSWEAAVLDDFAELRKAGLTDPLMDEIEKLFVSTGQARQ